ncbi:MAG TPA: hypothetical protein VFT65_19850 [Candidatus Angelobacter sp.]|nr:hypothetical protein [Candidatus Angelobacter sp.]
MLVLLLAPGLVAGALGQSAVAGSTQDKGTAGNSSVTPQDGLNATTPSQPRGSIHIVPMGRGIGSLKTGSAPANAHLTYFGGPVAASLHAVAVFWGPNVNPAITGANGIDQFFTDITSSRYYDLLTEYSTLGAPSPSNTSSNQLINHGVFDGKFTITPSVCSGNPACTITDAEIQAELTAQINASHLPAPVNDGVIETFYMIYFPPGVTISLSVADRSCVTFCAYHSSTPALIPYGVLPDFAPPSGCSVGCGRGSLFQNVTAVTSHEMSETITDLQVGSAIANAPPLAWYDPSPPPTPDLGEIGDICNGQDATVTAGNNSYSVQAEFSNLQNDCVINPPVMNLTNPTGGVGPNLPFNLKLTIQSSVNASTLSSYTGTVHFSSPDATAVLPADYTFVSADAGSHVFSVTLKNPGSQTINVVDTHSSGFNGSVSVVVNTTPDLVVSKTHSGNFLVGQTGATYTITASNIGGASTVGTVTVVDTLPPGLTATAISGTGWTCTLATLTCTRADGLAGGSSYPAITLTVNVDPNASQGQVTNTVNIAGGGETNLGNDAANDLTSIVAPITDLQAAISGNASAFQGDTGLTLTEQVSNIGTIPSTGVVTATTTLGTGLSATAISGTGWGCTLATLTCTRSDALAAGAIYPVITVTFSISSTAPASAVASFAVSGGGDANAGNNTANFGLSISQVVTITTTTPNAAVLAGQPATFAFHVGAGAAAGTVSFSCTGLPAAATCSFSPTSVTGSSATVTMTVSTTAHAATIGAYHGPSGKNPLIIPGLLFLAGLAALTLGVRAPRRRQLVPALGMAGVLIVGILAGCGGGGSSTAANLLNTGTPAGAYVITFTASGPGGTASKTVNLTVQ